MAVTHSFAVVVTRDNVTAGSASFSQTQEAEFHVSLALAASQTNYSVPASIATAKMKSFFIVSDTDLTLETNSGSSPAQTFALKAGVPFLWHADMPVANPFTTDVTGFFLTNGVAISTVKILFNIDV